MHEFTKVSFCKPEVESEHGLGQGLERDIIAEWSHDQRTCGTQDLLQRAESDWCSRR